MGSCAAPSAKGDDKFITTDYLQQCLHALCHVSLSAFPTTPVVSLSVWSIFIP
ncbi:replication initiator protein [Klebsiella pneumoniae]|nr:replication initiator protein [Klebsiella pneumoniae]MCT8021197.1 replication initiator protein [Klebsiella pneumoniae]MCT8037814.1 replication initiator protein [Klebsiella pneumoniae]MCT8076978.1 replication initiator protein [Klebsiella pneumoniae]PKT00147.1 replication initiator protein [Klebsiella pneumoniae]